MVAAALNPADLAVVAGTVPFRKIKPPAVAGYEGVVDVGGRMVYISGPPLPFGTLGELVPVPDDLAFPVPGDLDPVLAATLGIPGLPGWRSTIAATSRPGNRCSFWAPDRSGNSPSRRPR